MNDRSPVSNPAPGLRLLGLPLLVSPGGAEHPLAPKDAALLAVLALEGAQPRKKLAAWFWPDKSGPQRNDSLRQRLMRLDDRCGVPLFERAGLHLRLHADVGHDLLDVPPASMQATPALLGALQFDELAEFADWLGRARERLQSGWRAAWAAQVEALEQRRQIADALPLARRLAEDEPLHEHHWRRLMRLHYLRGDRSAARAAYAELARYLAQELGGKPSAETQQLAAVIDSGAPLSAGAALHGRPTADLLAQLRRPVALLQRETQRKAMTSAWQQGHSVLLLGEGGIGKSRLLDDHADEQGLTLRVAARPGDAQVPYALMGRLLRERLVFARTLDAEARSELARLDPTLGPQSAGPLLPVRLGQALAALLAADGCLAIDDLHYADSASAELLPALLEPPRQALLASRPDGLPAALAAWTPDCPWLHTVRPTPLQTSAVVELLASMQVPLTPRADWAAALARHTGGNPQLLLETLRALLNEPPVGPPPATLPVTAPMQQLVAQRLQALSPAARALAHVSALAGGEFDVALAAHALECPTAGVLAPWQELQSAQVMTESGFVHDLLAEAVRAEVPPSIARALHRRLAEYLHAVGVAPARCAVHWALAGMPAQAALSHAAAARAAADASRRDEEHRHWAAAADAHRAAGDALAAFDDELAQSEALVLAGQPEPSLQLSRQLCAQALAPAQQARATAAEAQALLHLADWAGAHRQALQAADLAASPVVEQGLSDVAARAFLTAGTAAAQMGRSEDSLALVLRAEQAAAGLLDDRLRLGTLDLKAHVLDRVGRFSEAEEVVSQAIVLARTLGEHTELMNLLNNRASILGKLARLPEALAHARQASELGRRIEQLEGFQGLIVTMHSGLFGALCGDFRYAIDELEAAHAGLLRQGLQVPAWIAEHNLALVWLVIGQVARAQRILASPLEGLPRAIVVRRVTLRARLARLCGTPPEPWPEDLLDGSVELPVALSARLERARRHQDCEECRRVAELAQAASLTSAWFNARLALVDTLLPQDPAGAARSARQLLQELSGRQPIDAWWPDVLHVLQRALRADGDAASADGLVTQAVDWLAAARSSLPPHFRASFDSRNRVNAALLAQHAAFDATLQSRPGE